MALDNESFNKQLYDLLKVRGYNPVPKNSKNQDVDASQLADVIEFQFIKDGENYGKAWASIDDAKNVIIYYDEAQADSPEGNTPGLDYDDSWSGFLKHVKTWAQRKQLSFELLNKDRLNDAMKQREYVKMKENLREGYYPMGKQASYSDAVPTVKIILQHSRQIQEGEQRYRNIAKIFLENAEGERILAPTTRPGIAQVYARHLAEGGLPNDQRWNHIKGLCEEYQKMAGFVRATRNGQFNESAQQLVNEGINHYNKLRESLGKLRGHKGYNAYFESWTPALMEDEAEDSTLNELFVQEQMDPRIESAMPILSRLRKHIGEMTEVNSLSEWADGIINEKLDLQLETDSDIRYIMHKGKKIGEIGIDSDADPGVGGKWYAKHYASGEDLSGFASPKEAKREVLGIHQYYSYGDEKLDEEEYSDPKYTHKDLINFADKRLKGWAKKSFDAGEGYTTFQYHHPESNFAVHITVSPADKYWTNWALGSISPKSGKFMADESGNDGNSHVKDHINLAVRELKKYLNSKNQVDEADEREVSDKLKRARDYEKVVNSRHNSHAHTKEIQVGVAKDMLDNAHKAVNKTAVAKFLKTRKGDGKVRTDESAKQVSEISDKTKLSYDMRAGGAHAQNHFTQQGFKVHKVQQIQESKQGKVDHEHYRKMQQKQTKAAQQADKQSSKKISENRNHPMSVEELHDAAKQLFKGWKQELKHNSREGYSVTEYYNPKTNISFVVKHEYPESGDGKYADYYDQYNRTFCEWSLGYRDRAGNHVSEESRGTSNADALSAMHKAVFKNEKMLSAMGDEHMLSESDTTLIDMEDYIEKKKELQRLLMSPEAADPNFKKWLQQRLGRLEQQKAQMQARSSSRDTDPIAAAEKEAEEKFKSNDDRSSSINPDNAFNTLKGGALGWGALSSLLGETDINEGMGEADMIVQDIISGEQDAYTVMSSPTTPEEEYVAKILQKEYNDVASETGLNPDDDLEEILDIVIERLSDKYNHSDFDPIADRNANERYGFKELDEVDMGQADRTLRSYPRDENKMSQGYALNKAANRMGYEHYMDVPADEVDELIALSKKIRSGEVEEGLDANQKRAGQLGPTEKVGPKGAVGKLVGANESVEHDPLDDIKRLLGK